MNSSLNRLSIVISLIIVVWSTNGVVGLNCRCDDGTQCKSGSCQAPKNWYGPEHCQLLYDPSVNGERAWRGCNLANSNCDIVAESSSIDATFTGGKLSSFGGCCGEENCDGDLETKLGAIRNNTCSPSGGGATSASASTTTTNDTAPSDFSCICDPNDMATLFDLSVERGVQWFQTAVGDGSSNGSSVYDMTTRLRRRMSGFCSNNMCNANTIAAAGVAIPSNAFPVCVHLVRADNGKQVRGCTFAPKTVPPKEQARRVQASFPANPIAGAYDYRVAVNASNQYSFVFECRADMCNERQYYENLVRNCLPGIELPTRMGGAAVEPPPSGATGGVVGVPSVGTDGGTTTVVFVNSTGGDENVETTTVVIPVVVGEANGTAVGVETNTATMDPAMHNHNHNLTEPPIVAGSPETTVQPAVIAVADTNFTTTAVPRDASKTGSGVRHQALYVFSLIPVITLLAFFQ